MAKFIIAYQKTSHTEGKWCDVEGDSGGETWKGIARNYHPTFPGWKLIDIHKKSLPIFDKKNQKDIAALNAILSKDLILENHVQAFYKVRFWDIIRGDEITSQMLADKFYDNSVNFGTTGAIKMWQKDVMKIEVTGEMNDLSLNTLNQTV